MKRLAIITTHPIQYNAPLFRLINERGKINLKVFYTWGEKGLKNKYDPGFDKNIEWDIPLMEGYEYEFVENISADPGSHNYNGINNPELIARIEKWDPDYLLIYGWNFKSHLKLLRYFKGRKEIVFRGDSHLLDEKRGFTWRKILRKLILQWIYGHVDKALFAGKANRNYYLKYGMKPEQLIFAPHAIDNERFGREALRDFRKELGIPGDGIVFLFTGKLERKKNPALLIESFAKITNPHSYLVMVGNGPLEKELIAYTATLAENIRKRIYFIPFQNQQSMPAIYQAGDVLVLPSRGPGETWGLSVNEAMAAGSAVLVSNKCGCAQDLVVDGETGYMFNWNNAQDLLDKMQLMASQKKIVQAMGEKARQHIQSWSFVRSAEVIEGIVSNIKKHSFAIPVSN